MGVGVIIDMLVGLENQARDYFGKKGFGRIWKGFAKNYISFERMGGKVTLSHLTEEEMDTLEGFLQKDCHHQKSVTISAEQFRKALNKTKFAMFSMEDLFSMVYTEEILTKKQKKMMAKEKWEESFDEILLNTKDGKVKDWFLWQQLEETNVFYKMKQDEKADSKHFVEDMKKVLIALDSLPVYKKEYMRLPVFAASITGNPHAFDEGNSMSYYLLHGVCDLMQIKVNVMNAESKKEILYAAGILTDGVSNSTICAGIVGFLSNGTPHPGMQGFYERYEEMIVNLNLLTTIKSVKAISQIVYVVENPAVFEDLLYVSKGGVALVCSYGQPRVSTLFLLDRLVEAEYELFYAGDFDPEGLLIAQRLKDRYKDSLHLWHYEDQDYEVARSKVDLSIQRLKQCEKLTHEDLQRMAANLKRYKNAGYQENLLSVYREDIVK